MLHKRRSLGPVNDHCGLIRVMHHKSAPETILVSVHPRFMPACLERHVSPAGPGLRRGSGEVGGYRQPGH